MSNHYMQLEKTKHVLSENEQYLADISSFLEIFKQNNQEINVLFHMTESGYALTPHAINMLKSAYELDIMHNQPIVKQVQPDMIEYLYEYGHENTPCFNNADEPISGYNLDVEPDMFNMAPIDYVVDTIETSKELEKTITVFNEFASALLKTHGIFDVNVSTFIHMTQYAIMHTNNLKHMPAIMTGVYPTDIKNELHNIHDRLKKNLYPFRQKAILNALSDDESNIEERHRDNETSRIHAHLTLLQQTYADVMKWAMSLDTNTTDITALKNDIFDRITTINNHLYYAHADYMLQPNAPALIHDMVTQNDMTSEYVLNQQISTYYTTIYEHIADIHIQLSAIENYLNCVSIRHQYVIQMLQDTLNDINVTTKWQQHLDTLSDTHPDKPYIKDALLITHDISINKNNNVYTQIAQTHHD